MHRVLPHRTRPNFNSTACSLWSWFSGRWGDSDKFGNRQRKAASCGSKGQPFVSSGLEALVTNPYRETSPNGAAIRIVTRFAGVECPGLEPYELHGGPLPRGVTPGWMNGWPVGPKEPCQRIWPDTAPGDDDSALKLELLLWTMS